MPAAKMQLRRQFGTEVWMMAKSRSRDPPAGEQESHPRVCTGDELDPASPPGWVQRKGSLWVWCLLGGSGWGQGWELSLLSRPCCPVPACTADWGSGRVPYWLLLGGPTALPGPVMPRQWIWGFADPAAFLCWGFAAPSPAGCGQRLCWDQCQSQHSNPTAVPALAGL